MVSPLFFYQLVLLALLWLCFMLHWAWPSDSVAVCPTTPEPPGPRPRGVSKPRWWEAVRAAGLSRRRASAQPAARASPGGEGL
jgi:hypothetical protein